MILAIDIGNSAIKFGLFDGEKLTSKFSIPTLPGMSADEIKLAVGDRVLAPADGVIVCSVVPGVNGAIREFVGNVASSEPIFVDNSFDFGLKINYVPPDSLGTDRLVNAFAAVEKYEAPCVICSLGTATTIDVVSADREFLGGIIAPGLDAMADCLHARAPRLPKVAPQKPQKLIGNSTDGSIQSGIYNGYVEMVQGLVEKIRTESGVEKIILTGGNATVIARETDTVDIDLLLGGLRILAER